MATHFIHQLSLNAFRNIESLTLTLEPAPVVLLGQNGAGKTNVLEALSLLSPGRGLRRAAVSELQQANNPAPFTLSFQLQGRQGAAQIGIGRDSLHPEKRLLRIDGKSPRSQTALADHLTLLWLVPEMDRLLCDAASERRRFLDRLCFALDAQHSARVIHYETAMRARLKLLREASLRDATWLEALEATMARHGMAIAAARLVWLEQIRYHLHDATSDFPKLALDIAGDCETLLQHYPAALDAEDKFRHMLQQNRHGDGESGTTRHGPHRSDLCVTHLEHQAPAARCSTGEQKALLISLMLGQTRLLHHLHHAAPLLLLDDIASHLDEKKRENLAAQLLGLGSQAWLSGTDAASFSGLQGKAQFFTLEKGWGRLES